MLLLVPRLLYALDDHLLNPPRPGRRGPCLGGPKQLAVDLVAVLLLLYVPRRVGSRVVRVACRSLHAVRTLARRRTPPSSVVSTH